MYCVSQVEGVHSQSPAQDIIGDYSCTAPSYNTNHNVFTYIMFDWCCTHCLAIQYQRIMHTSACIMSNTRKNS